jgi:hypothetical protein
VLLIPLQVLEDGRLSDGAIKKGDHVVADFKRGRFELRPALRAPTRAGRSRWDL